MLDYFVDEDLAPLCQLCYTVYFYYLDMKDNYAGHQTTTKTSIHNIVKLGLDDPGKCQITWFGAVPAATDYFWYLG